jgi:hypothetical protein
MRNVRELQRVSCILLASHLKYRLWLSSGTRVKRSLLALPQAATASPEKKIQNSITAVFGVGCVCVCVCVCVCGGGS